MARTKAVESKYVVNRVFIKNSKITDEDSDEQSISVHKFITEPAEIGLTKGITLNLGNYEFARIDVTCKVPSYIEEVESAYEFANTFVEQKIEFEIKRIRGNPEKNNKDASPL